MRRSGFRSFLKLYRTIADRTARVESKRKLLVQIFTFILFLITGFCWGIPQAKAQDAPPPEPTIACPPEGASPDPYDRDDVGFWEHGRRISGLARSYLTSCLNTDCLSEDVQSDECKAVREYLGDQGLAEPSNPSQVGRVCQAARDKLGSACLKALMDRDTNETPESQDAVERECLGQCCLEREESCSQFTASPYLCWGVPNPENPAPSDLKPHSWCYYDDDAGAVLDHCAECCEERSNWCVDKGYWPALTPENSEVYCGAVAEHASPDLPARCSAERCRACTNPAPEVTSCEKLVATCQKAGVWPDAFLHGPDSGLYCDDVKEYMGLLPDSVPIPDECALAECLACDCTNRYEICTKSGAGGPEPLSWWPEIQNGVPAQNQYCAVVGRHRGLIFENTEPPLLAPPQCGDAACQECFPGEPTPTPTNTPDAGMSTPTPTPTKAPVLSTHTPTPKPSIKTPTEPPHPSITDTPGPSNRTPTRTPASPTLTPTRGPVLPVSTATHTPRPSNGSPTTAPVISATPTRAPVLPGSTATYTPRPSNGSPTSTPTIALPGTETLAPPTLTPTRGPGLPSVTPTIIIVVASPTFTHTPAGQATSVGPTPSTGSTPTIPHTSTGYPSTGTGSGMPPLSSGAGTGSGTSPGTSTGGSATGSAAGETQTPSQTGSVIILDDGTSGPGGTTIGSGSDCTIVIGLETPDRQYLEQHCGFTENSNICAWSRSDYETYLNASPTDKLNLLKACFFSYNGLDCSPVLSPPELQGQCEVLKTKAESCAAGSINFAFKPNFDLAMNYIPGGEYEWNSFINDAQLPARLCIHPPQSVTPAGRVSFSELGNCDGTANFARRPIGECNNVCGNPNPAANAQEMQDRLPVENKCASLISMTPPPISSPPPVTSFLTADECYTHVDVRCQMQSPPVPGVQTKLVAASSACANGSWAEAIRLADECKGLIDSARL